MASFKCSECVAKGICKVQKFDPLCDEFRKKLADTIEVQKPSHNKQSTPCPAYRRGGVCKEFGGFSNCGDSPCE